MRLLVLSDSHHDAASCLMVLKLHPEAEVIVHLGDGEDDLDELAHLTREKTLVRVRGNCSWGSVEPERRIVEFGGKRIYCCHGHVEGVKRSLDGLIAAASEANCDIALFGHTHRQELLYLPKPLYLFNPGSIRAGEYGMIDIGKAGVVCIKAEL